MKRVLILGASGFVGSALKAHLTVPRFAVETVSMRGDDWQKRNFAGADAAVMAAGIAHRTIEGLSPDEAGEYWRVNALLPFEAAKKAKMEGVRQFIFLSSMSVYGKEGGVLCPEVIDRATEPAPVTLYGKSKLEAEKRLSELSDDGFHVACLRPPMIYGPGCKGNYPLLAKAAGMLPFFPDMGNKRSMLYIGTLCRAAEALIESGEGGLFFPRNKEDVDVAQLVRLIALSHQKNIRLTKAFNAPIRLLAGRSEKLRKVFGSLVYDEHLPTGYTGDEETLEETVRITEGAAR